MDGHPMLFRSVPGASLLPHPRTEARPRLVEVGLTKSATVVPGPLGNKKRGPSWEHIREFFHDNSPLMN